MGNFFTAYGVQVSINPVLPTIWEGFPRDTHGHMVSSFSHPMAVAV
jgi:hypothetical protein